MPAGMRGFLYLSTSSLFMGISSPCFIRLLCLYVILPPFIHIISLHHHADDETLTGKPFCLRVMDLFRVCLHEGGQVGKKNPSARFSSSSSWRDINMRASLTITNLRGTVR